MDNLLRLHNKTVILLMDMCKTYRNKGCDKALEVESIDCKGIENEDFVGR